MSDQHDMRTLAAQYARGARALTDKLQELRGGSVTERDRWGRHVSQAIAECMRQDGLAQGADEEAMEELARWVFVAFVAGKHQGQEEWR